MAIEMVRAPSETPNITNIDDIIPIRYAYANQNGYVKGKGTEIDFSINGSNFIIGSGRIVVQGVESDIDANGVTLTIDNVATTRYYVAYITVNLATNSASITTTYNTASYPSISAGDDLTENSSGTANLALYRFSAVGGVISNVTKMIQEIKYTADVKVQDAGAVNGINISLNNNVLNAVNSNEYVTRYKIIYDSISGQSATANSPYISDNASMNMSFGFGLNTNRDYILYGYLRTSGTGIATNNSYFRIYIPHNLFYQVSSQTRGRTSFALYNISGMGLIQYVDCFLQSSSSSQTDFYFNTVGQALQGASTSNISRTVTITRIDEVIKE